MTEAQREALIAAINSAVSANVEYNESHNDAGDGYAHLPREGWSEADDSNLARFMYENGIDPGGKSTDELRELALDNFTMRAEHVLRGSVGTNFACGAYPVGEVETQVSCRDLSDTCGFDVTREDCEAVSRDVDTVWVWFGPDGTFECYNTSDVVWLADISADDLRKAIKGE